MNVDKQDLNNNQVIKNDGIKGYSSLDYNENARNMGRINLHNSEDNNYIPDSKVYNWKDNKIYKRVFPEKGLDYPIKTLKNK